MNLISILTEMSSTSEVPSLNSGSFCTPLYALPAALGLSFGFGLLLGIMFTVCVMKLQARRKSSSFDTRNQKQVPVHVQVPVYEELCVQAADMEHSSPGCKVVDNVAYGPMCN